MMRRIVRRGITSAVVTLSLFAVSAPGFAQRQNPAIANVRATLSLEQNANAVQGAGAVAAHARVGGNRASDGATMSPPTGGAAFSDRTTVAGTTKKSLLPGPGGPLNDIGAKLRDVYSNVSTNSFDAARDFILYRVVESADKVALARANGNSYEMTTGVGKVVVSRTNTRTFARAEQIIEMAAPNTFRSRGLALADIDEIGPVFGRRLEDSFAVGVVNDPLEVSLIDPSQPGFVDLLLDRDFHLDAGIPGSFASAAFEIAGGEGTGTSDEDLLFSFNIGVKYGDKDIDDVTISLGDHDATVIPDSTAFVDEIRGFFTFDASAHSLKVKSDAGGSNPDGVLFYQFVLPPNTESHTIRFDYSGLVGVTAVPEPSALVASLSLLAACCWFVGRRHTVRRN